MKYYILMQIGCPECKTETKPIAAFDDLENAANVLEACNKELEQNPRKVEFQVFQIPETNVIPEYYRNK